MNNEFTGYSMGSEELWDIPKSEEDWGLYI